MLDHVMHVRPYAHYLAPILARLKGPGEEQSSPPALGPSICAMITRAFSDGTCSLNYICNAHKVGCDGLGKW